MSVADIRQPTSPVAADRPVPQRPPRPLVELNGVSRRYGRLLALKDVNLTIAPGEFVFVTGPSEAGKTTLLKLIHGDLRPTKGKIRVALFRLNQRWRRFLPRLRRRAAAIFQDGRLLPDMTARGNVAFALQVTDLWLPNGEVRSRAQARLDEVGLGRRAGAYPHQLSGGQQRRLALARALAHDPQLLLADEPTANLDRRNAEIVMQLLERRCRAGATVIVATHDLELARTRPYRVLELSRGQVVADTPGRRVPDNGAPMPLPDPAAADGPEMLPEEHPVRDRLGAFSRWALGYVQPPPVEPNGKSPRAPKVKPAAKRPRLPARLAARLRARLPKRKPRSKPRTSLRARLSVLSQRALGYVPPPKPEDEEDEWLLQGPFQRRPRRPWVPVVNLCRLIVGGAVSSWVRNFGTVAPALGSIALLLLLLGALSVSGIAVRTVLGLEAAEASTLHVYLADDVTDDQTAQLRQSLSGDSHVRSVRFISKDQALAQARQRPGLGDLASMTDSNPFPASLEVRVDQPSNVGGVASAVSSGSGVDTRRPTSYDQGTYDRLRQATVAGAGIIGGFGLLMLFITYAVSSNSIRAAVLARRDELVTMQLVGASRWVIRARLAVEGALTGGLGGLLAVLVLVGACLAAFYGARHLFVEFLPGVTVPTTALVLGAVAALGICLGAVAALFAFRRLRR
jgi:cell division transport system ATP-binding protein